MTVDPEGARYRAGDSGGHYESWFLRGNHPSRPLAFWIRYTVTAPKDRPEDTIAELFAIAFDGELMRHVAVREVVPIRSTSFGVGALDVRIDTSHLSRERATGRATSGGHTLTWDLSFSGGGGPLLLLPEALYAGGFPKAKALVMRPGVSFGGCLEVDGEPWPVDGWVGSTNHNWGVRHTDQYTWGQVAGFEGHPDTFLELATARIRVGPFLTPALTPIVLRHGGQEFRLNTIREGFRRATLDGLRWTFRAKGQANGRRISLSGVISASASQVVTFDYKNPPGGTKLCINSKIARCELDLEFRRRPGEARLPANELDGHKQSLLSPSGAAFEVLVDDVATAAGLGITGLPTAL
jgi:hypothetical protein